MPKIQERELTRVCIRLYADDYDALQRLATRERSTNALIRDIVHQYLVYAGDRLRQKIDALETKS